jgi:hypothetical protein
MHGVCCLSCVPVHLYIIGNTNMISLFHFWRNSLLLLAPHNLKLFVLTTLKSTFETYKVLVHTVLFWALPAFILIEQMWRSETWLTEKLSMPMYLLMSTVFLSLATWLIVTYCLAAKPSMVQKNMNYFEKHRRFFQILILFAILLWQLNFWLNWFLASYHYELTKGLALAQALIVLVFASSIPVCIFFILFFLDSDGSIKQLWYATINSVKMTVNNLPLLILLIVATLLPILILTKYVPSHQLPKYAWNIVYLFLLAPFLINIWTNIYVKKLHEM